MDIDRYRKSNELCLCVDIESDMKMLPMGDGSFKENYQSKVYMKNEEKFRE